MIKSFKKIMIYLLMHTLQIDASPHQLRKLKKGLMVRIKKGTGFELQVHPNTYNIVSRAFNKGKGSQIQLSPEELEMNQGIAKAISPEAHGIAKAPVTAPMTGGKISRIGKANKWQDFANATIRDTIDTAGKAGRVYYDTNSPLSKLGMGFVDHERNTTMRPLPKKGGKISRIGKANKWQDFANATIRDTIDTAGKAGRVYYDTNSPLSKLGMGISSNASQHLNQALKDHLGTGYGRLARAGMDNYLNSQNSALMHKHGIDARRALLDAGHAYDAFEPHSRIAGGAIEKSTVGLIGSMLHAYIPPALVSQPFSANFQFQHFLPVQFQHFNSGGAYDGSDIMGNGLYI